MPGTDIPTGVTTPHGDVVQALSETGSGISAVAAETPIVPGQLSGPTYPGADLTGQQQARDAEGLASATAAMHEGMSARESMLSHYQAGVLPLGSAAIDEMTLPRVPEDASGSATPPAGGYLYGSGGGDQPGRGDAEGGTYAPGYAGNEPH